MAKPFTSNWLIYKCCLPNANMPESGRAVNGKVKPPIAQMETSIEGAMIEEPKVLGEGFDRILIEVVDEVFSMLGESARKAIYNHLERKFRIRKEEIPKKIGEFSRAVEKIFGTAAKMIEINIMRRLYEKVDDDFVYYPEKESVVFAEYVAALRKHYYTGKA
ncbi:MAG: hypothetical protein QXV01_04850 [Candidatus Bathyarchaeia archaeon]